MIKNKLEKEVEGNKEELIRGMKDTCFICGFKGLAMTWGRYKSKGNVCNSCNSRTKFITEGDMAKADKDNKKLQYISRKQSDTMLKERLKKVFNGTAELSLTKEERNDVVYTRDKEKPLTPGYLVTV